MSGGTSPETRDIGFLLKPFEHELKGPLSPDNLAKINEVYNNFINQSDEEIQKQLEAQRLRVDNMTKENKLWVMKILKQ